VSKRKAALASGAITAQQYLRDQLAAVRPQPACTVCEQTYIDPGPWGPDSLYEIQREQDWPAEAMAFEVCPECTTLGLCPDCIHEQECCIALKEEEQPDSQKAARE